MHKTNARNHFPVFALFFSSLSRPPFPEFLFLHYYYENVENERANFILYFLQTLLPAFPVYLVSKMNAVKYTRRNCTSYIHSHARERQRGKERD